MIYTAATVVAVTAGALILCTLAYTVVVDALGGKAGVEVQQSYQPIPEQEEEAPAGTRTTRTRAARA
jgi:hypothetical protein